MKTIRPFQFVRIIPVLVLCTLLSFACSTSAAPAVRLPGTGEPNNPYQIATVEQLLGVSSNPNLYNKCFILTADIDLDPNLPGRQIFQQAVLQWTVASSTGGTNADAPFEGRFDGNGHTIRNCVIHSTSGAGFIFTVGAEGIVRNLSLQNIQVGDPCQSMTPGGFALPGSEVWRGTLARRNEGTIVNCSATGTIVGRPIAGALAASYAGGLVAVNDAQGRIFSCSSQATVYGETHSGGLVATNAGTIEYCSASGTVLGSRGGGLASDNTGSIHESYSTATVAANEYGGGGLVYSNAGTIANCYVTGFISSSSSHDGLAVANSGVILTCYSTTPAQSQTGGTAVRGDVTSNGQIQYAYYLDPKKKEGQPSSPPSGRSVALSDAEMKQAASFVGFDFYGDANDGPAGHWFMPPDAYPVLTWQTEITGLAGIPDVSGLDLQTAQLILGSLGFAPDEVTYDYSRSVPAGQAIYTQPAGYVAPGSSVGVTVSIGAYSFATNPGDGTQANPYQISTPSQFDSLYGFLGSSSSLHLILMADIDIAQYTYSGPLFREFSGELNGNGHTIRNLQIAAPLSSGSSGVFSGPGSNYGLFGTIESVGSVHDLTIEQASVRLSDQSVVGILAGANSGQVLRCKVTGRITGARSFVSGLVGSNSGQMTDCQFSGRIQAAGNSSYIGGLAGSNSGTLTRCCARDIDVSGGGIVGGLVGGTGPYPTISVEACYATGTVRGTSSVGGLIGQNGGTSVAVRGSGPGPLPSTPAVTVRQCYAACSVTGQQSVGGLIGWTSVNAQQESCFFLDPNDGGGPANGLGAPLTAEQMKHQATFTGWDFADTWTICEGRDYPRLRWGDVVCP